MSAPVADSVADPAVAPVSTPAVAPLPARGPAPAAVPLAAHGDAVPAAATDTAAASGVALALLAELLAAGEPGAAAQALAHGLRRHLGAARVSVGQAQAEGCELWAAGEDAAAACAPDPALRLAAMDEAVEQGEALFHPATRDAPVDAPRSAVGAAEPTLAPITLAQRSLAQAAGGEVPLHVATLPLCTSGQVVGALCIERRTPFTAAEQHLLLHLAGLAAPVLALHDAAALPLRRRLRQALGSSWARLRDPRERRLRRVAGAASALLLVLALLPLEHTVGGRARVEGAEQRVLVAPSDGFLKAARAKPGDAVKAGQVLADLAEQDLQIERNKWASQLAQHENGYAAAMARADRGEAAVSLAKLSEAEAQLALVDEQLQRAQLAAPFDGVVIQGDLSQAVGAPVKQGDALMTVATTQRFRVIVQVDEGDIARVRPGQRGRLALSALPWDTIALRVVRITPIATAVEGANVFEVEAELPGAPATAGLRPGLQGRAKLVVGRQPLLVSWTQPLLDKLRLLGWRWIG